MDVLQCLNKSIQSKQDTLYVYVSLDEHVTIMQVHCKSPVINNTYTMYRDYEIVLAMV